MAPHDLDRVEPHLTATEVPFDDASDWDEAPRSPELRAVRDEPQDRVPDVGAELFPPRRKRRSRVGFVLLVGFVAIVAGIGVLAASFMTVTDNEVGAPAVSNEVAAEILSLKKTIADLEASAGASTDATRNELTELRKRLAELETGKVEPTAEAASSAPPVREISIDRDAAPARSTATLPPPPAPRARPAGVAAAAPADVGAPATAMPKLAEPGPDPAPAKPRAPVAKAAPPKTPASAPSDDDFLADIERTLDANRAAAERRANPPPPPPPGAVAANGPDPTAFPPETMIELPPDAAAPDAVGAPMELGRGAPDPWSPDGAPIPPEEIPNAYPMD